MGCDIHPIIEVRDAKTKQWVSYLMPSADRNYAWFGVIAGVRDNSAPTIHDPEGLPDDASLVALRKIPEDNADLHSHSWLDKEEISQAWRAYIDYIGQDHTDEVEKLTGAVTGLTPSYRDRMKREDLPIAEDMEWLCDIDENLDITIGEEFWYDDIRYVFAFDN